MAERAGYSISAVSKLTGVGCHTLRVWERRYGFPTPLRSPTGHRRYEADQVEMLATVARRLRRGEGVGQVMAELRAGGVAAGVPSEIADASEARSSNLLDPLQQGDLTAADLAYARAVTGLSPVDQVLRILEPCLSDLGERWFRGECDIGQEHHATFFLRSKLYQLLDEARKANECPRRTAIVGTVQGDRHEGGVLMLGVLLESAGWRTLSLGVDLPTREYRKAVDRWRPDAICLSFVLSRNIRKRFQELARIREAPVFVGGRSILNYQGLARKFGLHPLIGPGDEAINRLIAEVEARSASDRDPASSGDRSLLDR